MSPLTCSATNGELLCTGNPLLVPLLVSLPVPLLTVSRLVPMLRRLLVALHRVAARSRSARKVI